METFVFRTPRLNYANLFKPFVLSPENSRYQCVALAEGIEGAPSWFRPKEPSWRNAPRGPVISATSLRRVPVYGLSPDWLARVRALNMDPDGLLKNVSATVAVSLAKAKGRFEDTYLNLLAVEIHDEPVLPTFLDLVTKESMR